ncbi:MAG: hypothetical protein LBK27_02385 [Treponema sp.]|jgi:hypothetical protein|nr:hypothetical protein [Treponema sp.]
MELKMKYLPVVIAVLGCLACTGTNAPERTIPAAAADAAAPASENREAISLDELAEALEAFAGLERSGSHVQGMGLAESGLRERAGDFSGAALAAYKELAWVYSQGLMAKADVERGLENLLALRGGQGEVLAAETAKGLLAFIEGRWEEAEAILGSLFSADEEPDSFARWLLLACSMERGENNWKTRSSYGAIQARYRAFPEYWYRGARFFSGALALDYAERCIGLAPGGPFVPECREILAAAAGLERRHGTAMKTRMEIEELITQAVSGGSPELLSGLLPLISLPDNSYTLFAAGALRSLSAVEPFRTYFAGLAEKSSGRLAERLSYICGGRG